MSELARLVEGAVQLLRDPGATIAWGGYPALAAIVFLETGALVFFLPGDSLLVVAGLYAAQGSLDVWTLNALLAPVAIAGDATSYWIGSRAGGRLAARPQSWLFRPSHFAAARRFYERHGGKAVVLARFMPLVRTFVPVVAGAAGMPYRRFAAFNVIGAGAWVGAMTGTGYLLGRRFPAVVQHLEKVIVAIVVLSIAPALVRIAQGWARGRTAGGQRRRAAPRPDPRRAHREEDAGPRSDPANGRVVVRRGDGALDAADVHALGVFLRVHERRPDEIDPRREREQPLVQIEQRHVASEVVAERGGGEPRTAGGDASASAAR